MNPWLAALFEAADWAWDRWHHESNPESQAFDAEHELDTAGWTLDYEPIRPAVCEAVLDALPDDCSRDAFIDMGCGKGRVLLLASTRPFRTTVGVEYIEGLVNICKANLASWEHRHPENTELTVLHCDAIDFELPRRDVVLFLYNPFGADVMASVLARLRRDHDGVRRVTLAYVNPLEAHLIEDPPWTLLTSGGEGDEAWRIYRLA